MLNKLISWFVTKQLRPVLVNWKTTLAGVIVILPALHGIIDNFGGIVQMLLGVADGNNVDIGQLKILVAHLGVGVGLIFAKDGNKSTEISTGETPPKALPTFDS